MPDWLDREAERLYELVMSQLQVNDMGVSVHNVGQVQEIIRRSLERAMAKGREQVKVWQRQEAR